MMKRVLSLLSVLALLLALCACGASDTVTRTPAEIADEVLATQAFQDTLTALDTDMIGDYYWLDASAISEAKVYVSGSFSTAEEIAVFKAASKSDVAAIEKAIDTRLEDLQLMFESYVPGEMTKISAPVRVTKGDVVVLVLCDDTAACKEKVNELLK